jgi:hypothetical protein
VGRQEQRLRHQQAWHHWSEMADLLPADPDDMARAALFLLPEKSR